MLNFVFLTEKFYDAYRNCSEIEQKSKRPYVRIQVLINGVLWAIPLRSHIKHGYALWTDKENSCGIDFTKAVVIEKPTDYISATKPHIRQEEFKVIKRFDDYTVMQKFLQYIKAYKKAKEHTEIKRNKQLLHCSTLQYFEKYI